MKIRKNGNVVNLTESDLRRIVKRLLSESEEDQFNKMIDDEKNNSHISVDSRGKAKKICEKCIKPLLDSGKLELMDIPNCNFCKSGKIQKSQAWRCAQELRYTLPKGGMSGYAEGMCVLTNAKKNWNKIG
tara:strand:+ start:1196 stop:1585 length:390 start_codon:yes stop_codon:yes gene_type:complete